MCQSITFTTPHKNNNSKKCVIPNEPLTALKTSQSNLKIGGWLERNCDKNLLWKTWEKICYNVASSKFISLKHILQKKKSSGYLSFSIKSHLRLTWCRSLFFYFDTFSSVKNLKPPPSFQLNIIANKSNNKSDASLICLCDQIQISQIA